MNKTLLATAMALALAAAFPAQAQSNADILKELDALKAKVAELEKKLKAQEEKKPEWGMTPEQARELNRVTVKAEAMEDSRDASGLKQLTISGYADPTYIFNRNQGRAGFQFLNNVANDGYSYDNSYFGTVTLDFQKETDSGTKWRLTLSPNRGTDSVIGNGGLVHEATVSVPLSDLQTRLIAGHIPDWSGYEFLQPTLNKLITHNLLFDYTLPTTYTGAGLELTRGKWWLRGVIANMNASKNNAGEKAPVLAYRVDYSRGEFQGFGFAGVHGKATNFADPLTAKSRVDLFEIDGYFIRGDWTVQGQLSFGKHKGAAIAPDPVSGDLRDAEWTGLSALAAYKLTPRLEGVVRGDFVRNSKNGGGLLGYTGYWDPANGSLGDGRSGIGVDATASCGTLAEALTAVCNTGVNRSAFSFGLSYLFDMNTTFKVEYRLDRASAPVFYVVKDGSYRKSNSLFGASVLVSF
ncbi:MAG: DUF3138 family protein [Rubrivivax sp.]|nr:DUF3138 family protein [Rubrivivax sp.]